MVNLVPNPTLNAIPCPIGGDLANENGIAVDEEYEKHLVYENGGRYAVNHH